MKEIYPVLLAGGSGTRLWPLSRQSYPKQFSKLIGNKTLFQESALRLTSSEQIAFLPHITLTNHDFRFIIGEQLQEVGLNLGQILIEPEGKNTASAILAASIFINAKDKEATLLVAPCDHLIPDREYFHNAVSIGLEQVQNGKIVTFGIKPTKPETGYGYIELSESDADQFITSNVVNFVEKPNLIRAKKMIQSNKFLWNSGIFLFKAGDIIQAFKLHAPKTLELVSKAVRMAKTDLDFIRLNSKPWSKLVNISIDHAIMENVKDLVVVPYSSRWSDLGGWNSVWSESTKDTAGNVTSKNAHALNCLNTLLHSESSRQQIVGLGLENIVAISSPDAVLVANKNSSQDVRKVVDLLKSKKITQATIFPKDHRPWGWFESLAHGDGFQVKRIHVKPGAALSLQSHSCRSEHWIVVEGTANVTIDEEISIVTEGQSVYVPLGAVHRMENLSKLPIVLIEVQIGTYLGEDDIIRYEDIYGRN